jgi:hypothetical protein
MLLYDVVGDGSLIVVDSASLANVVRLLSSCSVLVGLYTHLQSEQLGKSQ